MPRIPWACAALVLLTWGCDDDAPDDTKVISDGQTCSDRTTRPIIHKAFAGSGGCAGVDKNTVIASALDEENHVNSYCQTVNKCRSPNPPCPAPPNINYATKMLLYVFGSTSGCSGQAVISKVLHCKTHILVQYSVRGTGACTAMVNAWSSVEVAASLLPVTFSKL